MSGSLRGRCLVALPAVGGLLLSAKHLFVAATGEGYPCRGVKNDQWKFEFRTGADFAADGANVDENHPFPGGAESPTGNEPANIKR